MVRDVTLHRRRLLAAAGVSMAAIAGCTGSDDDPETDTEENSSEESFDDDGDDDGVGLDDDDDAGLGDDDDDDDDEEDGDDGVSEDGYELESYDGTDIRLVPMEEALEWHEDGSAQFIDARPAEGDYDSAHIPGAVWNPSASGVGDESVYDWAEDETIVIYCSCPDGSSISGGRAASLIDDGYEDVFVLDETFDEWKDAGHPLNGEDVD